MAAAFDLGPSASGSFSVYDFALTSSNSHLYTVGATSHFLDNLGVDNDLTQTSLFVARRNSTDYLFNLGGCEGFTNLTADATFLALWADDADAGDTVDFAGDTLVNDTASVVVTSTADYWAVYGSSVPSPNYLSSINPC